MKGDIINCSANKDIYFLETNTKNESSDLANLFGSSAGREMFKYNQRPKLKHKLNPALDFFLQTNKQTHRNLDEENSNRLNTTPDVPGKCSIPGNTMANMTHSTTVEGFGGSKNSRRNSIDLYEEAASILGLTCAQTDGCKCLECQCHYFDFEEDIEITSGSEYVMDHNASSCSIQ